MKNTSEQQVVNARNEAEVIRFRLGSVDVDPANGRVSGPGGARTLDPKVMAVLERLARDGCRVVSRDDLMQDVWRDVVVTDFALSRCIYQLRKELSAVARIDGSPIETLPKRGYRLSWPIAPVSAPRPRNDGGFALAGIVALVSLFGMSLWSQLGDELTPSGGAIRDAPRLVIYPFDDLSEASDLAWFSNGLAREIQHQLAGISGLTLIGRTSAFESGRHSQDRLAHARELDADFLIDGSVQSFGDSRRVLVDLRTAPDGELLWSREFVVNRQAPFDVVQHVADRTVQRIRFSTDADFGARTTTSFEAFEAYLTAIETGDYTLRRQLLLRAVELDPQFAVAWNTLAAIEVYPVWNGLKTVDEAWRIGQPFVEQALAVNPELPDAYITLGRFRRELGDLDGAISQFERALELDPGNPVALGNLGIVLRPAGRYEEALEVHELAAALDPLDALAQVRLGTSHWLMENLDEAERHYAIAARLMPDNEEVYDSWSAMLSLGRGQFDAALRKIDQKMRVERPSTPRTLFRAGQLADALGLRELAERYYHEAGLASPDGQSELEHLATHYFALGEDDLALDLAGRVLVSKPADFTALMIVGTHDIESGRSGLFLERVRHALPETANGETQSGADPFDELLVASAFAATGQQDVASRMAQSVIDRVAVPRSYQHLWLAAAYSLQGDTDEALAALRDSPVGWVRQRAALLPRDPRFARLHDLPEFHALVGDHLAALDQQRESYLAVTMAMAEHRE